MACQGHFREEGADTVQVDSFVSPVSGWRQRRSAKGVRSLSWWAFRPRKKKKIAPPPPPHSCTFPRRPSPSRRAPPRNPPPGSAKLSTTTAWEQNRALGPQVYGRYPNPGKHRRIISTIAFARLAKIWSSAVVVDSSVLPALPPPSIKKTSPSPPATSSEASSLSRAPRTEKIKKYPKRQPSFFFVFGTLSVTLGGGQTCNN